MGVAPPGSTAGDSRRALDARPDRETPGARPGLEIPRFRGAPAPHARRCDPPGAHARLCPPGSPPVRPLTPEVPAPMHSIQTARLKPGAQLESLNAPLPGADPAQEAGRRMVR